jgi:hypothetical protein
VVARKGHDVESVLAAIDGLEKGFVGEAGNVRVVQAQLGGGRGGGDGRDRAGTAAARGGSAEKEK